MGSPFGVGHRVHSTPWITILSLYWRAFGAGVSRPCPWIWSLASPVSSVILSMTGVLNMGMMIILFREYRNTHTFGDAICFSLWFCVSMIDSVVMAYIACSLDRMCKRLNQ
ncbi:hypothetical protein C8R43DRAFT_557148 [Mycena crocata]|nr:hypothetical protein C8R43DRAFT_557148 [Mycena crocata]